MEKIKKIIYTGFAAFVVLFSTVVAPLSPLIVTVDASPYDDAIDIVSKEYKAWRSWKTIVNCMVFSSDKDGDKVIKAIFDAPNKGSIPEGSLGWESVDDVLGSGQGSDGVGRFIDKDDGNIDCNTQADLELALKNLGHDSYKDFMEAITGDRIGTTDYYRLKYKDMNAMGGAVAQGAKAKGLIREKANLFKLPAESTWVYWASLAILEVENTSFGNVAGTCDGVFGDEAKLKSLRTEESNIIEPKLIGDAKFINGWKDDATKEPYKYLLLPNKKGNSAANAIDGEMTKGKSTSCTEVAKEATKDSRVQAFADLVKKLKTECEGDPDADCDSSITDSSVAAVQEDGAGDGDVESCEIGSGLFAKALGFVVCAVVDITFSIVDWTENNIIIPYLIVSPLEQGSDSPAYTMWSYMRDISNVMLVLALLYLAYLKAMS